MTDTPEPRCHTAESEAIQRQVLTLAAIGRDPRLIPDTWEAQAQMVDTAVAMGTRLTLVVAMIVARSKEQFADPSEWVRQCTQRWGWVKSHLHHMCAVGDLLRRQPGSVAATLMALDAAKLLAISRLPPHLVAPFLEKSRPQDLSRDEVRAAVNRWLVAAGEPPIPLPGGSPTPPALKVPVGTQADFLDLLFAAGPQYSDPAAWRLDIQARARAVSDPAAAKTAAVRALVCVDALLPQIAPAEAGQFAQALRDLADTASAQAAGLAPAPRRSP